MRRTWTDSPMRTPGWQLSCRTRWDICCGFSKEYQEFWNFFQVVAHKAECLEKDLNLRGAKNDFEKNINQLHEKVQMTIEKKEKVR